MNKATRITGLVGLALIFTAGCDDKPAPTTGTATKKTAAAGSSKKGSGATKTAGYEGGAVSGGGTIGGKVTWEGDKPKIDDYPINKDPDICDTDKKGKRVSDRLIVGDGGGVKNAVVYIEEITKGKAFDKGKYELNQQGCEYHPHIMVVPKGSAVSLKSSDKILHNIHMFGAATYNLPFPDPTSVEKKMRKKGIVRLQCDAGHAWMSAYIHAVGHPYYAITDDSGAYSLSDVPAGSYTVKMWHESWKVKDTVKKDGKVSAYVFDAPVEMDKKVEVKGGAKADASFTMKGS